MEKKHDYTSAQAEQQFPGADVNKADKDKVSEKMVRDETRDLNNNPRNNDFDE